MTETKVDYRGFRIVALWGGGFWQACAVGSGTLSAERVTLADAMQEIRGRVDKMLGDAALLSN